MSNLGDLDSAQSREVEEQLFATHRLQINRHVPVPLPRQDFWSMVHQLLKSLDSEIQNMLMKGMTGMRLQNLQKRQANIRLIASELARKRLVALMQHVSSQSLRTSTQPGITQDLPALDWQRHDPAEKAIYHMMQVQIDRFKMEVDWNSMQNGIAGETIQGQTRHAPGTVQLDSFIETNLTGSAPPDLAFEDREPPAEAFDSTGDEEERFIDEEWPDLDEYIHADLSRRRFEESGSCQRSKTCRLKCKTCSCFRISPFKECFLLVLRCLRWRNRGGTVTQTEIEVVSEETV